MKSVLFVAAIAAGFAAVARPAMGQTPKTARPVGQKEIPPLEKDTLPPPQEVIIVPNARLVRISPPQIGQRNVWELYSVDSRGRFLPRVIMTPHGYY